MKRLLIAGAIVFATALHAHAATFVWHDTTRQDRSDDVLNEAVHACELQLPNAEPSSALFKRCMRPYGWRFEKTIRSPQRKAEPGVTVWNKDSRDPNVGWHTENGMRVCTHDCDNPEIPGSGAVCRDLGNGWRDCVTDWIK